MSVLSISARVGPSQLSDVSPDALRKGKIASETTGAVAVFALGPLNAPRNRKPRITTISTAPSGSFLSALQQAGHDTVGFVRHFAGKQFVEDQAEGKKVRALIEFLAERLLRRHVVHGSDERAGLGHAVAFERARQAEVHDQNSAGLIAHDVLRLQVTMNDPHAVRGFKRTADLLHDLDRFLGGELVFLVYEGAEILTLDVLHGDELHPLCFAQVVNADYIFVGDLASKEQFLLEAVENSLIAGKIGSNDFQGYWPTQLAVHGLVDRAHPAFAQNFENFVSLGQNRARLKHWLASMSGASSRARRRLGRGVDHGGGIPTCVARKIGHCRRIKRIRGATRSVNHGRCIRRRTIQIGGRITTARRAAHRSAAIPVVWWLTLRAASAEFFHGLPLSPCQHCGREASSTTKTCARAQRARLNATRILRSI